MIPGNWGIVPEHVELPGRARLGTEDITLEAEAVDNRPYGRFGPCQIGVGLVIGAPNDLRRPSRTKACSSSRRSG